MKKRDPSGGLFVFGFRNQNRPSYDYRRFLGLKSVEEPNLWLFTHKFLFSNTEFVNVSHFFFVVPFFKIYRLNKKGMCHTGVQSIYKKCDRKRANSSFAIGIIWKRFMEGNRSLLFS